jgi:amino acid adenylation domain-containing protein
MNEIDEYKYIDFSFAQKDTLLQHVVTPLRPETLAVTRTPKKMRLERMPLSGTTSAIIQAIRRVRVECLSEYFEQTCDRRSHDIAVICGPSQLTYLELDSQANRLAHFLISCGVKKGNPVGILLERSLDTYVALLGVLKAGAAFVPLNPVFPADLVAFIAEDAGLSGLVTISAFREKTNTLSCPVLEIDQAYEALSTMPETRPQVSIDPASLCYITYTSDTPGKSKGVAVSHTNITTFLHVATPIYGITHNDRVYQGMPISFDSSLEEIWLTWIAGATLIAGPTGSQYVGHELTKFLIDHQITTLCCPAALLATIERDVPSLRALFIIGGVCPTYLISRWSHPRRRILNTYGSPETTVMATWCELFPNRPVTIGSPLPTCQIYLLDDQLCPAKNGEIGEICIGGSGVAMGYLNRPELTKERFITNPIMNDRKMMPRLYRTGDFGRITPAGEIEHLGQINTQVMFENRRTEPDKAARLALLINANTPPLEEYAPTLQFETIVIPEREAKASKLNVLKQMSVKNIYQKIMTDPLYKNSIFNMASTFILGGLGFVFWIIIARLYKLESVGIATTLISLMTLLSSFTVMGLNVSLNRYLPKSANKNELITSSFIIVTFVTLLVSIIFLLRLQIFSPKLLFLRSNIFYIISFTVFIIFCSWNTLVESISMAFRVASNILIKNTTISLLKLLLPFTLIIFGAYGIFASTALALTLGVLLGLAVLIIRFKIRPSISLNVLLMKKTWTYSFANYITNFMSNMPSLALPIIILNTLSAKYAAYYYVASMVQSILLIIPLATSQSLLTEGSYDEENLVKHVKKAISTILFILIPATATIVFGGNILLQVFGRGYASEAFPFLRLYSISTFFTSIILISNAIMNIKHQVKSLVTLNIIASVLTLWFSYAFISDKLVGIGWGWVLGQTIAGAIALFFIIRNVFLKK